MVKRFSFFSDQISEWGRNVIYVTDCWCQTGWFEYLRKSLTPGIFTHNSLRSLQRIVRKTKKHPVSSSSAGKNVLLMREVRGEGTDWSKLIGRWQLTVVCKRVFLNTQSVKPIKCQTCTDPPQCLMDGWRHGPKSPVSLLQRHTYSSFMKILNLDS